jgi:hypothetical protein
VTGNWRKLIDWSLRFILTVKMSMYDVSRRDDTNVLRNVRAGWYDYGFVQLKALSKTRL